ncbi:guanine deaminase [Devosia sp. ZB163]|uniref:guanine deaminase n=1 Tax=Devosia sp. ZB163 TaxID=3025938 RepID=UPI002361135E|nr:guanine deaminase [Devosia sp. ZB163]MDC9822539.1 guanine deaminase [Devosia sp. ZB163]
MTGLRGRALRGTFVHAPVRGEIEVLDDVVVSLDAEGRIDRVVPAAEGVPEGTVELPAGQLVLPGFVDLHVHAPQYPQLGLALDEPLEVWLQKYTFPLEARYADLDFAREAYGTLVTDLLAGGTTTALYFATVHREATELLAEISLAQGQRALVGKVVMDLAESCPDYYRDATPQAAIDDTRAVIDHIRALPGNDRVLPVITPRFIPSCTDEALTGLGQLAAECGCHVQTHCSESDWAHGYALERFGRTDTDALRQFGLLTRKTVLAHSVFLTDADMDEVRAAGAGVAHCALSNMYFGNAVFPLRKALDKGLHVGLGTDISGGPSASMLEACRTTVAASRVLDDGVDAERPAGERGRPGSRVDMLTAFHLATAGGGVALDLDIGLFRPGYHFDALIVDPAAAAGTVRLFGAQPVERIEQILYTASRANLAAVYVGGDLVSGADRSGAYS